MDGDPQYGISGRTVLLDVTVTGDADTVSFYNFYEPVGLTHQEPFDLEWTPLSEGEYKIRAVAYHNETGLSDQDQVFFSIRDKPFLLDLSASVLELVPPFDPDIVAYTVELPGYINDVPPLFYESVTGSTTTLQEAPGVDQRVYVDQEDRTTVIRVEEEGNPENYTEYRVTFRLNTGAAPATKDTILYETFGNEDFGFDGLASEYTKFSSDDVAGFIQDSVSINEWWKVSPVDQGATGEAKLWLTMHADAGDTLHFTGIDISGYSSITGLSWWSFANTGWTNYHTKAPAVEISVDGGDFTKLFIPGEIGASEFNCQSRWGKLELPLEVPLHGSTMTFRAGTYDDQQWMIDDILLVTETGECYSTLRSLALSTGELDYDPDVLTYQVELDTLGVPEVTYAPTNEEASVTVQEAVSVNQRTHPDQADRTTTVTVSNCGEETAYQIIFTTTATGIYHMENSGPVIYPNPANDFIHLKGMDHATKLEVCDIMGTMVKSVIPDHGKSGMLNISELPGGLYVIRFFAGEQMTAVVKFSKCSPPR
jgi:hypothetical protein